MDLSTIAGLILIGLSLAGLILGATSQVPRTSSQWAWDWLLVRWIQTRKTRLRTALMLWKSRVVKQVVSGLRVERRSGRKLRERKRYVT